MDSPSLALQLPGPNKARLVLPVSLHKKRAEPGAGPDRGGR
jgi:hypothetical protein